MIGHVGGYRNISTQPVQQSIGTGPVLQTDQVDNNDQVIGGININIPTVFDNVILENMRVNIDTIVKKALVATSYSYVMINMSHINYYIVGGKAIELSLNPEIVNKLIVNWKNKEQYTDLPTEVEKYAGSNISSIIKSSDWDIHIFLDNIHPRITKATNTHITKATNEAILDKWSMVFLEKLKQKFNIFSSDLTKILNLMGYEFEKDQSGDPIGFYITKKNSLNMSIPLIKFYITIVKSSDKSQKTKIMIADVMLDLRNNPHDPDVPKSDIVVKYPEFTLINTVKESSKSESINVCSMIDLLNESYKMIIQQSFKHKKYVNRFVMLYNFIINDLLAIQTYLPNNVNSVEYFDYCKTSIESIELSGIDNKIFSEFPLKIHRSNNKTITPDGMNDELINFKDARSFEIIIDKTQKMDFNLLKTKFTKQHYEKVAKSLQHFMCIYTSKLPTTVIDSNVIDTHHDLLRKFDKNGYIRSYTGGENLAGLLKDALFKDIKYLQHNPTGFNSSAKDVTDGMMESILKISNYDDNFKKVKNSKDFLVYSAKGYFYVGDMPNYDYATINVGDILMLQFFVSTSISYSGIASFGYCPCCIFRINVKKDSTYAILMNYSHNPSEKEILLPAGGQLVVKDVKYQYFNSSGESSNFDFSTRVIVDFDYIGPPSNCKDAESFIKLYRFRYNVVPENEKVTTVQSVTTTSTIVAQPQVIQPNVQPFRMPNTKLINVVTQTKLDDTPTMADFVDDYKATNVPDPTKRLHIEYHSPNFIKSKGYFDTNNKKTGHWIVWNMNNYKMEEGDYLDGMKNGNWTIYNYYGKPLSVGSYINDKKTGPWNEYEFNYLKYKGYYDNDEKIGHWEQFDSDGSLIMNIEYKDGTAIGGYTENWPNGNKKAEGRYLSDGSGKKTGIWTLWSDNGKKIEEGSYTDGEKHGVWTKWYHNGQKQEEGAFKNGVEVGVWEYWEIDGTQLDNIDYGDRQAGGAKKKSKNRKIKY